MRIGIIGGSGLYRLPLERARKSKLKTPYGTVELTTGLLSGREVVFLPRHGEKHSVPPHLVNYRGNLWALKSLGVERILAICACGSMDRKIKPGDLVLFDQFIDFTKSRPSTFFEGGKTGVVHTDMTEPYCPELRRIVLTVGRELGVRIHEDVTYVCTEGPRFETPAEIRMFVRMGGKVVGMTGVPECVLARELQLCYCGIGVVTNMAAGLSQKKLSHSEVLEMVQELQPKLVSLLSSVVGRIPETRNCCYSKSSS